MKTKCAILTIHDLINFGNRLQNYAMQELLKQKQCEVVTLAVKDSLFCKTNYKGIAKLVVSYFGIKNSIRYRNFFIFTKKWIREKIIYSKTLKIPAAYSNKFDFFVVGSDQVWNPNFFHDQRYNFFLQFAEPQKRFAVSPSITSQEIPDDWKTYYKECIESFNMVSVREQSSVKLVEELTGKTPTLLIDPTLALKKAQWEKLFPHKAPEKDKYSLLYFLGEMDAKTKERIAVYARDKHLNIIDVRDKCGTYYTQGPDCFIELIAKAQMVFTDSFHAVAFSINFNVPFYVFDRLDMKNSKNMYLRIESLLRSCQLMSREQVHLEENAPCDFTVANQYLNEQRKIMDRYLDEIIDRVHVNLSNSNGE